MHSAERLLRLLGLLQGRVDWTADDLARRLEVTPRTIRRDIARLRELGYPVEAMAGPGGGYRLGAGGKLPPLLLDDEEALAVALGLRVSMATVGGLEEASLSAMGKLEQVLPPRIRQRVEDFSEATVTVPGYPVRVDPVVVAVVTRASRERQRIRFSYRDARGAESERHAEPLRMVHTGRRWYLVAYDMDREDWRSFRVDRMKDARPTGMRSMRRPAPDPVEMINQGVAVDVYSRSAEVILHVPIDIAQRMIPITIGRLEEEGSDRSRLLIGADEMGWLASFLVSLGVPFDVVSPDDLKAELVALGKELIERHG
ncbi:MAG: WYL domain-containing protein [Acidimicrobiales bacterium]|nr:WYL domain-containing protein [Acidimicrobiales bacterium]